MTLAKGKFSQIATALRSAYLDPKALAAGAADAICKAPPARSQHLAILLALKEDTPVRAHALNCAIVGASVGTVLALIFHTRVVHGHSQVPVRVTRAVS
jgi:hypothetical protein